MRGLRKAVLGTAISACILIGFAGSALAAGTITGYVYQSNGTTPINGINVWADGSGVGTLTNPDGSYSLSVPAGSYRIGAGGSNSYVMEFYNETPSWNDATMIAVADGGTRPGINFTLDVGGTISGHVYIQDGTTPINQENITVFLASSEGGWQSYGARTNVSGSYSIVVPYGDWKVRAGGNTIYAPEYYSEQSSPGTATIVPVSATPNTNIDFTLVLGGTVSGKITNESGNPINNLEIRYRNNGKDAWRNAYSNSDGAYLLQGLPEGIADVTVRPAVSSGYAWPVEKDIYLKLGENKTNIDFVLKPGFLVSGYVKDPSAVGVPNIEVDAESALSSCWVDTDTTGYYQMRLPAGTYGMGIWDDSNQYTTLPKILIITGSTSNVDFTVYTSATGGVTITGTVTNSGSYSVTSGFGVVAFLAGTTFDIDNFDLMLTVSEGNVVPDGGAYSILVPPAQNYDVHFITQNETADGIMSVTVRGSLFNVPAGSIGKDFTYNSVGGTITGIANYYGAPVLMSGVFLTNSLGNFAGFADTDQNGTYLFYNVPAGNYSVQAAAHEYGKSPKYDVGGLLNEGVKSNYLEFVTPVIVTGDLDGNGIDDVIINFGPDYGIWVYYNSLTWIQLHNVSPKSMVVGSLDDDARMDLIVDFGSTYGIWIYYNNSTWQQLHSVSAESIITADLDNNDQDDIIIDFGSTYGIWIYSNNLTWSHLHDISPKSMIAADMDDDHRMDLIVDFGSTYGIWVYYNNSTWSQLHSISADSIVANDLDTDPTSREDIIVDFGDAYGIWIYYNNDTWRQLHSVSPVSMALRGYDSGLHDIIADFGSQYGIWIYSNNSTWSQLHPVSANSITAGELNGNGIGDIIVDFGPQYGVWIQYDNSTWAKLHNLSPNSMVAGSLD